jgi:hypothetical protein
MPTPPDFTNGTALDASSLNRVGLWKITSGSLSGSSTNFVGCFSSDYDNYRVVVQSIKTNANADIRIRMLNGTTPLTNSSYVWTNFGYANGGGALITEVSAGLLSSIYTGLAIYSTGIQGSLVFDVNTPNLVKNTIFMGQSVSFNGSWLSKTLFGLQQDDISFDGFQFTTLGAPTMTGTVTIYGYRK